MTKINFENRLLRKINHFREITRVDGRLNKKFIGALTIELLRKELTRKGFNVSDRNVYIMGGIYEIDLLILKEGKQTRGNLLFNPSQVVAIFEIKFSGIFTINDVNHINETFRSVRKINPKIKCVYLTVSELSNYTYRREERKLGDFNCFLFDRDTDFERAIKEKRFVATGDWDRLVEFLNKLTSKK